MVHVLFECILTRFGIFNHFKTEKKQLRVCVGKDGGEKL